MSSDTYGIEIRSLDGATVELRCTTGTAVGPSDLSFTRSFALMAIADGMPYTRTLPLQRALAASAGEGRDWPEIWKEAFHREHVGEFVAAVELVERSNIIDDEAAWQARYESGDAPQHEFVLRVRMTDPRWLEGVEVGVRYGTTGFDAWWQDDPHSPSATEVAAVTAKASHWR
ncbi:hypothetical protein ACNOYE_38890 [Nannocystaceae bacterium ST9]